MTTSLLEVLCRHERHRLDDCLPLLLSDLDEHLGALLVASVLDVAHCDIRPESW
jgi:hypothetical protein